MPHEERRLGVDRVADESLGLVEEFAVQGALAFLAERPVVLDALGAVIVGPAVHDAALAESELFDDLGVLREVVLLRVLAGVQVVQDAEELIETVHGRQVLVAVTQVVLAELARPITQRLEHLGQRRIFLLQADLRPGQPDRGQPHPDRVLAGDERRPACRAGRLGVVIHEDHALVGDPVDVGRRAAHHSSVVSRDVPHADVVTPDDQDVRAFRVGLSHVHSP